MTIQEKLSLIQQEFKAKKSRYNSFGKYNFRSAEDILEALKPINKKYNVYFTINERISETSGVPIIHSIAAIHDGDQKIEVAAIVGVDLNQKGMQVPQQFGSASSYGKKYALGNLLLIDDTADSDATNTHGKSMQQTLKGQVNALEKKIIASKKPVINNDNIDQAKKFLANGGLMKTLQEKYTITDEALKQLNG